MDKLCFKNKSYKNKTARCSWVWVRGGEPFTTLSLQWKRRWGSGVKSRALPVHALLSSLLILLFGDPHLLEGSLEDARKMFKRLWKHFSAFNVVQTWSHFVCPYQRCQDGASYPGAEPALHCSAVCYQLQPHTLQKHAIKDLSKNDEQNVANLKWKDKHCSTSLTKAKDGTDKNIFSDMLALADTHRRGFLGEFSVQSVSEALNERVSTSHHHTAIQTLG